MEGTEERSRDHANERSGGDPRFSRRGLLTAAGAALAVPAVWSALKPNAANGMTRNRVGVSIAGGEFSSDRASFSNEHPGTIETDYTYNSERSFSYFSSKGFRLQRLPFRWERLQPIPGGSLNPSELAAIRLRAEWAKKHGSRLILDCHNYGRYVVAINGVPKTCTIGERVGKGVPITPEHLINLWVRLSRALGDSIGIDGWGLMNEPHGLGRVSWKSISQEIVTALRKEGDKKRIFVAGDEWSNAQRWSEINGTRPWISDPLGRTVYEAHCYFDANSSGKYNQSFSREYDEDKRLMNRGVERVQPFLDWCGRNRVSGMIGEFGVPASDPAWEEVVRRFLSVVNDAAMEAVYWAGGEWWGRYPLSIQPTKKFTVDSPLLKVLQA